MWTKDGTPITNWGFNVLKVGATRKGKSLSGVADILARPEEAAVIFDPHKESLAEAVLTHVEGDLRYARLSDFQYAIRFALLKPSTHPDPVRRAMENLKRAEAFTEILLRRRGGGGMAGRPLMEEHAMAAILLFLNQKVPLPLWILPFAFMPDTDEFKRLVAGCTLGEIKAKFQQLAGMPARAQRAEVGSALRLFSAVFRSPVFAAFSGDDFDIASFVSRRGMLIFERGEDVSDDTMRVIYGAVSLLFIEYAKSRKGQYPRIRVHIDEATNSGLFGSQIEGKALAETSKNGLNYTIYVQNLDFEDGPDGVLQNCLRHEWFGCPHYDLARKGAVDILAGLRPNGESRAARLEALTDDIANLPSGWRWVRDPRGSWKEYVPMLENPWPDWGNLRQEKLEEKICQIRATQNPGGPDTHESSPSSDSSASPPPTSPPSSAARRWKSGKGKPPAGS